MPQDKNLGWRSEWRSQRNKLIERTPDLAFDPSSVVVRWKPGAKAEDLAAMKVAAGLQVEPIDQWRLLPGVEHLRVLDGTVELALQKLQAMPMVVYAEPDYIVRASQSPNDPSYGVLWGLHNTGQTVNGDPGIANADINAPEAWAITTGSPSVVIADIDSGVNYNHPDLAANAWLNTGEIAGNGIDDDGNGYVDDLRGWDFFSNDSDPMDDNGHGTHTAGTFGGVGNNGTGVVGVSWQCQIMALKFLSATGSGSTTGAIGAVDYAVRMGVKVSNNSWGGGGFSQALFDAINASRAIGHVFVAAAGNNGVNTDGTTYYPQGYALDNILSVAASDNNDARASFSNYGASSVDLAAPGVNIYSCYGSGYAYLNGTSMATPHVTGVVALVQGRHPEWTYAQVRDRILSTVRPAAAFAGITVTGGILDAFAAVNDGVPTNAAPVVTMTTPPNGATFPIGTIVNFVASATDAEDGALTAGLQWTSSLDGAIGAGGSFQRSLSVGTHLVTASVTDSGGRAGSAAATVTIAPPAPTNDGCAGAIALADGVAASGTTGAATNDGTASCGASTTSPDVWFRYTTSGTSAVTVDTCGSAFDTVLSVYTGSCGGLSQLLCNDDNGGQGPCGGGTTSYLTFNATPGTTYYIRVAGYSGATGSYVVKASGGNSTPATPPAAPTSLRATQSGANSSLTWIDNSNNETLFRLERQELVRKVWTNTTTYTVGADVRSALIPTSSGRFRWRIRAENAAGTSAWTGYVSIRIR